MIVVDGGSTDETVAVAQKGAQVVVCGETGRGVQQNLGAAVASGGVLLFLHADCRLDAGAIAELQEHLAAAPDTAGGCFRQVIDARGLRFRMLEAGNAWRARILKWAYGDQGIFVRADVFRELGGFPEIPFMEDLFFMKRLKRYGRVISLQSPLSVSARRWQQRGVALQTLRNWSLVVAAHLGSIAGLAGAFLPERPVRFCCRCPDCGADVEPGGSDYGDVFRRAVRLNPANDFLSVFCRRGRNADRRSP